jgi:hypothetical protein
MASSTCLGERPAATHRHTVPMQDAADRSPFDAELITQLVNLRAGLIGGDQLLDLLIVELPGSPGAVPLGRRQFGYVKAGELLAELF